MPGSAQESETWTRYEEGLPSPGPGSVPTPQMVGYHQSVLSKEGAGCLINPPSSQTLVSLFTWFLLDQQPLPWEKAHITSFSKMKFLQGLSYSWLGDSNKRLVYTD